MARNSAAAEKSESESEGGQKFLPPNPLPFCPPERSVSAARSAAISQDFVQNRFELRSAIASNVVHDAAHFGKDIWLSSVEALSTSHVGFAEPNLSRRSLGTGGSSAFLFTLIPKFLVWGFIYAYFDWFAPWGLALLRGLNAPVCCFNNNIICGIILLTIE
ncbi:MAG: hypothetical protein Q8N90_00410 [bacterium]|nr:hypothetical protein [bacterium]